MENKSEDTTNLHKNIWPQERDYMERPERYRYVRRVVKPDSCVFCDALNNGLSFESLCVYKNEHAMVVLNKYPYNTGHTLILPTRHCGDITELSSEEYLALSDLLLVTVKALKEVYECAGLNVGLNHGRVAGAGIPEHLHWHIVPRWMGDTNFFPLIAETKVISESIEETYKRLSAYFKELS